MIASKIYKVINALNGTDAEPEVTAATIDTALDDLAAAILANPVLNPTEVAPAETTTTEPQTPGQP